MQLQSRRYPMPVLDARRILERAGGGSHTEAAWSPFFHFRRYGSGTVISMCISGLDSSVKPNCW
jgi:hypothetical protein